MNKKAFVGIIVMLIIICGCVAGFLLLGKKTESPDKAAKKKNINSIIPLATFYILFSLRFCQVSFIRLYEFFIPEQISLLRISVKPYIGSAFSRFIAYFN